MPASRLAAGGAGEGAGGSASASSCLRWFNFLSGVFEGELSFEEKLALQVLRRFASISFERGKPNHEQLLQSLRDLCFRGGESGPVAEEDRLWKEVGFQSADPRRDFRGGGLLALQNICFFRASFPDAFLSLQMKSAYAGFPMAAALINVTHMLTSYLRLNEAVTLGQGEPAASRRSARCFARLCLSDCGDSVTTGLCASHVKAFRDATAGSGDHLASQSPSTGVGGSHSDTALLQQSSSTGRSVADKRVGEAITASSSRRQQSCGMGEGSAPPSGPRQRAAWLQPPRPLYAHAAARTCRRPQRSEQRCDSIDACVLNAFGHLFVYSCLRLEKELGRRGAWDFDKNEGPPQAIPLRCSHGSQLLAGLRKIQEIRRASIEPLLSPRCGMHGRGSPLRHSLFGSASPKHASSPQSDVKTLRQHQMEGEERSGCTTAEEGEDPKRRASAPSPSPSTSAAPETPCCIPASAAPSLAQSPRASTTCRPSRLQGGNEAAAAAGAAASPGQAEGEEAPVVSRRAHLCFGDALRDVRNAVDAALSDGTVHALQDLEIISRGCY